MNGALAKGLLSLKGQVDSIKSLVSATSRRLSDFENVLPSIEALESQISDIAGRDVVVNVTNDSGITEAVEKLEGSFNNDDLTEAVKSLKPGPGLDIKPLVDAVKNLELKTSTRVDFSVIKTEFREIKKAMAAQQQAQNKVEKAIDRNTMALRDLTAASTKPKYIKYDPLGRIVSITTEGTPNE